jgi:hypothetical protein
VFIIESEIYVHNFLNTHPCEPSGQLLRRNLSDSSIKRHALQNYWGGPHTQRVISRDPFPEFEQWQEQMSVSLFRNLFIYLPVYFSIYLFVYLFLFVSYIIYLFTYLSIYM